MPIFWLGLVGLLIFYAKLRIVSRARAGSTSSTTTWCPAVTGVLLIDAALAGDWTVWQNALSHLVLPAAILGYFSLAYISRMTRRLMLEQLRQEYILTARVKGLSETRVIWRHAFGNTAVPLITVIALSYANLLEGSVLTEIIFAWPGLGLYITNSLLNADMNAVLGRHHRRRLVSSSASTCSPTCSTACSTRGRADERPANECPGPWPRGSGC